jgi:hypothetical protein
MGTHTKKRHGKVVIGMTRAVRGNGPDVARFKCSGGIAPHGTTEKISTPEQGGRTYGERPEQEQTERVWIIERRLGSVEWHERIRKLGQRIALG